MVDTRMSGEARWNLVVKAKETFLLYSRRRLLKAQTVFKICSFVFRSEDDCHIHELKPT